MIGAGAQVLGGVTIGENARIGSNAVVLKDVPDGCTMVGNPARPVNCDKDADFAYGLTRELIDPLAETLERLEKELAALKKAKGASRSTNTGSPDRVRTNKAKSAKPPRAGI
ncbi:MAG: hypothetical protein LRY57_05080 [Alphaproteobacteria bacterium]|nr:hypothetical protein [Alphaproteobacteria bacterium]